MRRARDPRLAASLGPRSSRFEERQKGGGGYMDGMDLPSSESEGETETVEREQKTIVLGGKTEKEERKARQKELEAARKEAMAKEQADAEDDDAFNVRCANLTDEHRTDGHPRTSKSTGSACRRGGKSSSPTPT